GGDGGNRPDLHRAARMVNGHDAEAKTDCVAWFDGGIYRRRDFASSCVEIFVERRYSSRHWHVDLACFFICLVGRLTLFAHGEERGVAVPRRRATNALRRGRFFVRRFFPR